MKSLVCGAASIAAVCGWAFSAPAATPSKRPHIEPPGWVIAPGEAVCRTELELTGRSGAVSPVALISDGGQIRLRFAMEQVPERAFLPIRIDRKAYANLILRADTPKVAVMTLSDETLAAMRKGGVLQIAWLSEEPVRVSLVGAAQAIGDLRVCGAQVAAQHRARLAVQEEGRARAAQEARAKAVADEQLATARAQRAAAEAERQRLAAEADRATAEARQAQAEAERQRAMALASQQRAEYQRRQAYAGYAGYAYDDEDEPRPQWIPPRPTYSYRPYDPRYDR
jgi:hypothetical protein